VYGAAGTLVILFVGSRKSLRVKEIED